MHKTRLEAFSDGVIAIIITIMVLELKVPHSVELAALNELWPVLFCYVLSFIYVGIYWNNHHHLFHAAQKVDGLTLWANLHLLFWLSLFPFVTGWMGENHFAATPVAAYGIVLLLAAIAYFILVKRLICHHGEESLVGSAIGRDRKGLLSILLYVVGILVSFVMPLVAVAIYLAVAGLWLLPDRRIERRMNT